jgi:hypothetical protein
MITDEAPPLTARVTAQPTLDGTAPNTAPFADEHDDACTTASAYAPYERPVPYVVFTVIESTARTLFSGYVLTNELTAEYAYTPTTKGFATRRMPVEK